MARGYPDWSRAVGTNEYHEFLQVQALPPVWWEDLFDWPLNKWAVTAGTGTMITVHGAGITAIYPLTGGVMLRGVSAVGGTYSHFMHLSPFPMTSNIGFDIWFAFIEADDFLNATTSLTVISTSGRTNNYTHTIRINYNPRDGNWYYMSADGATLVLICNQLLSEDSWHYVKLIIDPINHVYLWLQIDGMIYNLARVGYGYVIDPGVDLWNYHFVARSDVGDQVEVLIDRYKITYGES